MTQAIETPITVYTPGGSSTGPFATGWKYAASTEVLAFIIAEDGVTPLVAEDDFTVAALGGDSLTNGGEVTVEAAAIGAGWAGRKLAVVRMTPAAQSANLGDTAGFRPEAAEQAFDKLTRLAQDLRRDVNQAVLAPYGEAGHTLPSREAMKDKFLVGNSDTGDLEVRTAEETAALLAAEVVAGIEAVGAAQGAAVTATGAAQRSLVVAEGDDQIERVEGAGTAQVLAVNTASSEAQTALALILAANFKDDIADGLATTSDGDYFVVAGPVGSDTLGTLYKNDGGAEVFINRYPALSALIPDEELPDCVMALYLCEEGGGTTLHDVLGGENIDLTTGSNSAVWADGTLTLTEGWFKTPAWTDVAAFGFLFRQNEGADAGYLWVAPSGNALGQAYGGTYAAFPNVHVFTDWGIHRLSRRDDGAGSAAWELNGGGWVGTIHICATPEDGQFTIGAGNGSGAAPADYMEIEAIFPMSAAPTRDEMARIRDFIRARKTPRGVYLTAFDCPDRARLIVFDGESLGEGATPKSVMSDAEQAMFVADLRCLAVNAASMGATGREMEVLSFADDGNNNPPSTIANFGAEWGVMLAKRDRPGLGGRTDILKVAQGSTVELPLGTYTNATGGSTEITFSNTRHPDAGEDDLYEGLTLFYMLETRHVYRRLQRARNEGLGYTSAVFVDFVGVNSVYLGELAVTSSAQVLNILQDTRTARIDAYGIANLKQIVLKPYEPSGLGGDSPDFPNNAAGASRLVANGRFRAGCVDFQAANSAHVLVLDGSNYPRGPDGVHPSKAGDDLLGRAIDAVAPYEVEVIGT